MEEPITEDLQKYYRYLVKMRAYVDELEQLTFAEIGSSLNKTEKRVLLLVCTAEMEERKVISAELSRRLGITRSAVSQIVDKLEKLGYIRRTPSARDRKIAYIEIRPELKKQYEEGVKDSCRSLEKIVAGMGRERFLTFFAFADEFMQNVEKEKK